MDAITRAQPDAPRRHSALGELLCGAILDHLRRPGELPLHSLTGRLAPAFSEAEVRAAAEYLAQSGRVELDLTTDGATFLLVRLPGLPG